MEEETLRIYNEACRTLKAVNSQDIDIVWEQGPAQDRKSHNP